MLGWFPCHPTLARRGPLGGVLPEQLEGLDDWREQDKQSMNLYPYAIEGKDYYLISGDTYPIWPLAKKEFPSFQWMKDIAGNPAHSAGVILQSALDKQAFLELMDKWGWTVNEFTDVEEEDDEEEDE